MLVIKKAVFEIVIFLFPQLFMPKLQLIYTHRGLLLVNDKQAYIDAMIQSFEQIHNHRYWQEITPFLNLSTDSVVCELGCGHGLLLQEIWQRYRPGKLIGIDLRPEMLSIARDNLSMTDAEVLLIEQHLQQNQQLPIGLDLVLSSRILRSFEDQIGMLSSIHSSLNDNGMLIILDWALADLPTYEHYLSNNGYSTDVRDIVYYHRNFSRYSLTDWQWLLQACNFTVVKSFQHSPVHIVIIATK